VKNDCARLGSLQPDNIVTRLLLLLTVLLGTACLTSCQAEHNKDVRETRLMLGTVVRFTVAGLPEEQALRAIKQAAESMRRVEAIFTTHGNHDNSVQAFNRARAGETVKLAAEVDALLEQSLLYQQQTHGAFDPTLGYLNQAWGFSGDQLPVQPLSSAEVARGLACAGVDRMHKRTSGVWVKDISCLELDFGAIAKGLAIDRGMETLKRMGVTQAIINAGGDIRVLGTHAGKPWRIAIQHPRRRTPLGWLAVTGDSSIVTSGDYERFFMYRGVRYHHILNPDTGFPADASMSVTVQASRATAADALSTALFVMGYKRGIPWVESQPGIEALWVSKDGRIYMSSGFKMQLHTL